MKKSVITTVFLLSTIIITFFYGCKDRNCNEVTDSDFLTSVCPTPPMGWNSYDCYDWRVSEREFKANVDFMEKHLLKYGWEYAVVDYLWHIEDTLAQYEIDDLENRPIRHRTLKYSNSGKLLDPIAIDEFGRVLPDPNRFTSSKNGKGFKPLADYVHSKGMKFGIHIMRGIPRKAVFEKMKIKGTNYTAADIAELKDTSIWENSMFGVDHTKPGAQEYYNSLIELYASWGVDLIKADEIMYPIFHKAEIEMIHKAIVKCGRPIVLSLSLGEPQMFQAKFLQENANMWRISGDFWDEWDQLHKAFVLTDKWSFFSKDGTFPDADMIPFGHLSLGDKPVGKSRISKFTWPEHYTLMTLWSMARSPLFIGSNLPTSPDSTIAFFQNEEVIYVNQHSQNGHQIYRGWTDNTIIWIADDSNSEDRFFALFNIGEKEQDITFDFELEYLRDKYKIRNLWQKKDLGVFKGDFKAKLPPHGAGLYRMSKVK